MFERWWYCYWWGLGMWGTHTKTLSGAKMKPEVIQLWELSFRDRFRTVEGRLGEVGRGQEGTLVQVYLYAKTKDRWYEAWLEGSDYVTQVAEA